jgi:Mn-dependent DtxR family transcriptional regulator
MTKRQARQRARLMAVMLTGAQNLTAYKISELAHLSPGTITARMAKLEGEGIVAYVPGSHCYYLTYAGRKRAISHTGLDL